MGVRTRKLGNLVDQLVEWQAVVVADGSTGLTAVSGRGYFINTTAGAITVTLPSSPNIGDTIMIVDYASTFATNNVTLNRNGKKIEAEAENGTLATNDQTHTLVFTDDTQGWKIVNQDTSTSIQKSYTAALLRFDRRRLGLRISASQAFLEKTLKSRKMKSSVVY